MDTSGEYIKMCAEAEEIQNQWIPNIGDVVEMPKFCKYLFNQLQSVSVIVSCQYILRPDQVKEIKDQRLLKDSCTWLPRQDQLQDMAKDLSPLLKLESFVDFCFKVYTSDSIQRSEYAVNFQNSMEQLWLAFVMKEKFGKIWSNGEWKIL